MDFVGYVNGMFIFLDKKEKTMKRKEWEVKNGYRKTGYLSYDYCQHCKHYNNCICEILSKETKAKYIHFNYVCNNFKSKI